MVSFLGKDKMTNLHVKRITGGNVEFGYNENLELSEAERLELKKAYRRARYRTLKEEGNDVSTHSNNIKVKWVNYGSQSVGVWKNIKAIGLPALAILTVILIAKYLVSLI